MRAARSFDAMQLLAGQGKVMTGNIAKIPVAVAGWCAAAATVVSGAGAVGTVLTPGCIADNVVAGGVLSSGGRVEGTMPSNFINDLWLWWCRANHFGLRQTDVDVDLLRHVAGNGSGS